MRKYPALVVFLRPFRLIESKESGKWNSTIEQINTKDWDFIKLHEIVGGVDVGLKLPYHLMIGFDGALALPPIPELRDQQKLVEFFNKCLAGLLIGGVYCEAVTLDDLEVAHIIDNKYIRIHGTGKSGVNTFHNLIRMKYASPYQAISLLNPNRSQYFDFYNSMVTGIKILNQIPNLSAEFILKGTTGIARLDWGAALSNLWIVVEQLVSYLWKVEIVDNAQKVLISGRADQLNDTRSWSIANKIEMLFQKGLITEAVVANLSKSRKARNELVHKGVHPTKEVSFCVYNAILELMSLITKKEIPLSTIDLQNHSLSDPFNVEFTKDKLNPKYWMSFPKLPNEEDIDNETK